MLNKDQAEAAADALTHPARTATAERQAERTFWQNLEARKPALGVGAVLLILLFLYFFRS